MLSAFIRKTVFSFIENFELPGFGFLILTLLSSIVSDEKLAIIWIIESLYIIFFSFLSTFKFPLSLSSRDLIMMCPCVTFFVFILLQIHWASRMYKFMFSRKLGNILAIISLTFFSTFLFLLFLGFQLHIKYTSWNFMGHRGSILFCIIFFFFLLRLNNIY